LKTKISGRGDFSGLQTLIAPVKATYALANKPCLKCRGRNILQETDTFDTWFLSGQWPVTTLSSNSKSKSLQHHLGQAKIFRILNIFIPTSVLDTMWIFCFSGSPA